MPLIFSPAVSRKAQYSGDDPIVIARRGTQFVQWPAFVKGCGLDGSKIRLTNIDPASNPPALITGQVTAIAG